MTIIFVGILTIGISLLATWLLEYGISKNKRMHEFLIRYQPLISFVLMTAIMLIPGILWIIYRRLASFQTIFLAFVASLLVSLVIALLLAHYEDSIVNIILEAKMHVAAKHSVSSTSSSIDLLAKETVRSNAKSSYINWHGSQEIFKDISQSIEDINPSN